MINFSLAQQDLCQICKDSTSIFAPEAIHNGRLRLDRGDAAAHPPASTFLFRDSSLR
jgi:hypothetical protein